VPVLPTVEAIRRNTDYKVERVMQLIEKDKEREKEKSKSKTSGANQ
jgi:hypothetical protein